MQKHHSLVFAICCATTFAVLCCLAASNNYTGDTGDSITHYMFARYAWVHHALFFNQWAKPLFVLLASPFAQFGFTGIKILNCLLGVLSCFFTYKVAKALNMNNAMLVLPIMFFCPMYFAMLFSGLTEYMFAFFLITAIYLTIKQKYVWALVIISFLPFVRAEGMIVMGVFGLYLLATKRFKYIPLLLVGNVAYSIAGSFYYHDILWVFTKLPYANLHSQYGHGLITDFIHILMYDIEKPVFVLMCLGFLAFLYRHFRKGDMALGKEESILIYDGFALFFIAHSIFWWKGIFSSGGFLMPRVMNAEVPLIAIIALGGLNFVLGFIHKPLLNRAIVVAVVVGIILFPFTNRKNAIVFNKSLFKQTEIEMMDTQVAPYIKANFPDYKKGKVYYAHQYVSLALDIDPFDTAKHGIMHYMFHEKMPPNTPIVWDDWFAPVEEGVHLKDIANDTAFVFCASYEKQDHDRIVKFAVFKKK